MADKEIILSVIVTVYNLEKYIGECLESLVMQKPMNTEIIVVDDGSCDKSRDIILNYAEKNPSLIKPVFLNAPGCMGRAHRRGYELATGKYCQFIDGDDWLKENAFEEIFKVIRENHPDVIMAKSQMYIEKGAVPFKDADIEPNEINGKSKEQVIKYLTSLANFHMFFWRYVFKKENIPDLMEYAINKKLFLNDWLPASKILLSGDTFACLKEPFYIYRQRQSSSVSKALKSSYPEACFFTFLEFINLAFQRAWSECEMDFIYSRMGLLWEMSLDLSDLMSEEQLLEVAQEMERFKNKLMQLEITNEEIEKLRKEIKIKGCCVGLKHIAGERKEKCLKAYTLNKGKKKYIFPTGQKSEYAARVLLGEGYQVEGFLDNDPNKDGFMCCGVKCHLPNKIEGDIVETGVIISTIWPKAYESIYSQLLRMGLKNSNITEF